MLLNSLHVSFNNAECWQLLVLLSPSSVVGGILLFRVNAVQPLSHSSFSWLFSSISMIN